MKLVTWNVNGLRAVYQKGFTDFLKKIDADVFCIQETKMQPGQLELDLSGYLQYFYSAVRKGYSGTAVFTKKKPLQIRYGIGIEEHDQEGRVLTLEYDTFFLVNCYTPNSRKRVSKTFLSCVMGRSFSRIFKRIGENKTGYFMWRLKCSTQRN